MGTELSPKKQSTGEARNGTGTETVKKERFNPIAFCRKYKFEAAVIAAAVVCVVSMTAAGIIIFSDDDEDAVPKQNEEKIVTRMGENRFGGDSETDADIALSWTAKELRLDGIEAYEKLSAEIYPVGYSDQKVTWRSSNDTIAKIDAYGNITAYAPGEVILEAYHEATGKTKDAVLKVIRPVTGIFMPTTEITMNLNDAPVVLQAWLTPDDASVEDIKWTSKDPSVAAVDGMGRVKPVSAGMTEIIVSNSANDVQSKCFVTVVNQSVNVDEVAIQNKENNSIQIGNSLAAVATVLPNNAKNKTLTWSSSNENVAVVNANGTIRALSEGTARITASASNGVNDSIDINVTGSDGSGIDLGNTFLDGFHMIGDMPDIPSETGGVEYVAYDLTLDDMVNIQMASNPPPQIWINGGNDNALTEETAEYLDPNNFYTGIYKYQFLDLSHTNGISEEALNAFLEDKGILRGQAAAFIAAANEFGISEVYLAAHACLETGNGTSQLAVGTEVNGVTVYNMFGIAAYDTSAIYSGSKHAYDAGWTSVEAAIRGGAEWISTWYINSADGRQNTLYKMRWNPERPSEHQYATDVGWAVKQAANIESIFRNFPDAVLTYEVPVYNGMVPPVIE